MRSKVSLESISDGRSYDIGDLVKADAGNCEGCSACCHGVGELVILTPFDVFEIIKQTGSTFDALLLDKLELHENGKITLPHLKMHGEYECCGFLSDQGRCTIHQHRPNICRLFPLGRYYDEGDFKYFLQVDACTKDKLGNIKVEDWIDIKDYPQNKAFILTWYKLLKALAFRVKFIHEDQALRALNEDLLSTFYRMSLDEGEDFYTAFYARLPEAKNRLGVV